MFFVFEISRPIQWKPYFYHSSLTVRFCWLLFAFGWHTCREDELIEMAMHSGVAWEKKGN